MNPLYHSQIKWDDLVKVANTANPGLIFDKFPSGWKWNVPGEVLADNAKKDFYKSIIDRYKSPVLQDSLSANLTKALVRQNRLVEDVLGGKTIEMRTDWRFVSGQGASHPYEAGFIWHRILGIPYLPGSSVKGMIRAWAEQWQDEIDTDRIVELFGSKEDSDKNATGRLIIFDALPAMVPVLDLDILNPHYQEYYSNPVDNPPADYMNPVPVFFLTVAAGQNFIFSLAPRPGAHKNAEEANANLETGLRLLEDALANIGVGGKTAVGYGVMHESPESKKLRKEEHEKIEQELIEEMNKENIGRAAEEKGYFGIAAKMYQESQESQWERHHDLFYDAAKSWMQLIGLEKNPENRNKCIEIMAHILNGYYPGILDDPDKKQGKKGHKHFYKKPHARELAKQLIDLQSQNQGHP